MSVQIHINGDNATEVIRELSALASHLSPPQGVAAPAITEAPKTDKPSRSSRSTTKPEPVKEEPPVQPEADPEEQAEDPHPAADPAPELYDDAPIPSVVDLRAKAQEVGTTQDAKKAIKALLDEFGSKSISDVPEKQRVEFLARLDALDRPIDISDDDLPF